MIIININEVKVIVTMRKKINYMFLFVAALLFLGFYSCGGDDKTPQEEWKYVGDVRNEEGGNVSVFIDLKSMEIEGQTRKFWIRYYDTKIIGSNEERYLRQLGYWEVDCQDRELHVLSEEYYGEDGQVLGRAEKRFKEEYEEGALGDKLSSAACRYAGRN